jgi:ppGpp synthetase/RelA/SpoT-type nucleotidyltranferase
MSNVASDYSNRYRDVLSPIAAQLECLIVGHLHEAPSLPRIDRVSVRAKSPSSFLVKAAKKNDDGSARYVDPIGQIQDQIGARIITFYKRDGDAVCQRILKFFARAEEQTKEPESEWEFGYFGRHFILMLPGDAVPRNISTTEAPAIFELQVRTLFEHAWSESEHDLVYKAPAPLSRDQLRRCAFTAAQAWGADRAFQELFDEVYTHSIRSDV